MNWPFENDTGAVIRKIASSRLKHDKLKRSISIFAISLAAMLMDAGIGDTISIFMPDTQEETVFRISGYLETAAAGTDRTLYAAVVSEQYYREQNGWTTFPPSVLIRVNTGAAASRAELEERIAEIMKKAGIESTPSMNEAYINLSKPSALLVGTAIAGLAVITAAGVLVIYCIFYIAIINSIKEYGQLRTIGMTGRSKDWCFVRDFRYPLQLFLSALWQELYYLIDWCRRDFSL